MKAKNLVLGAVAVVFAATGAIASILVTQPTYVWGTTQGNSSAHCILVGNLCTNAVGAKVCTISVPIQGGGSVTPTQVFSDFPTCTTLLREDNTISYSGSSEDPIKSIIVKNL